MELLSGAHDGELPKIVDEKEEEEQHKYAEGFSASYFFFDKGTGH